MKLYIFYNIFGGHSSGLAVAIANSKEEAIQILTNKNTTQNVSNDGESLFNCAIPKECFRDYVHCEERELDDPCGYFVYGGYMGGG